MVKLGGELGDILYGGDEVSKDTRRFVIDTVEREGSVEAGFQMKCNLPFVEIRQVGIKKKTDPANPGYLAREYQYSLRVIEQPPDEMFVGEISVSDPWEKDRVLTMRATGRHEPLVRAMPERIILSVGKSADEQPATKVILRTKDHPGLLRLEPYSTQDEALIAEKVSDSSQENLSVFVVKWSPHHEPVEGMYKLKAYFDNNESKPTLIPVLVTIRGQKP